MLCTAGLRASTTQALARDAPSITAIRYPSKVGIPTGTPPFETNYPDPRPPRPTRTYILPPWRRFGPRVCIPSPRCSSPVTSSTSPKTSPATIALPHVRRFRHASQASRLRTSGRAAWRLRLSSVIEFKASILNTCRGSEDQSAEDQDLERRPPSCALRSPGVPTYR